MSDAGPGFLKKVGSCAIAGWFVFVRRIMSSSLLLFGKEIPLYGLCYFGGIGLAGLIAILLSKKHSLPYFDVVSAAVYAGIGGGIGAKILFLLVSWRKILELGIGLEGIIKGGFVFYGGLLGGTLGIICYTKQYRLNTDHYLNLFSTVLPLGHAVGRVGCFLAGCCYGIPYDGFLSYTYYETVGDTPLGVPLLPIQLIEAALLLVLFISFVYVYLCFSKKDPCIYALYLTLYPAMRFILEFWRGDAVRGSVLWFSTSQWISIFLFLFGVWKLHCNHKNTKFFPL